MQRSMSWILLISFVLAASAQAADSAVKPASVKLWRLDCGAIQESNLDYFSDTYAYVGKSIRLSAGCYLIKHGDTYMLWDTGLPIEDLGLPLEGPRATGETLTKTLSEQLAALGVAIKQIEIIGISHYHFDHVGQAKHFPQARLLMGKEDIKVLRVPGSERAKPLTHWLSGAGALEEIAGDKDVFGDQTVVMLDLPGHTPGHHGLLVRLATMGNVLLSGDVAHFTQNYVNNGVPAFNVDRAQSLASLDRFKSIAKNLRAIVVIQHEASDIGKLPAFPAFAE